MTHPHSGISKGMCGGLSLTVCFHTACPVPVGIIKAMEVASGLNLPKVAVVNITKWQPLQDIWNDIATFMLS